MRSSNVAHDANSTALERNPAERIRWVVPLGRLLYASIFLTTLANHFSPQAVQYAAGAGVPYPNIAVPLSGIIAIAGGLSVLFGFKARAGAWLLVLFLVPVTIMMHAFWAIGDAGAAQMQMVMFMKNVALLGSSLMIAYFGAGPVSVDAWMASRAARQDVERGDHPFRPHAHA